MSANRMRTFVLSVSLFLSGAALMAPTCNGGGNPPPPAEPTCMRTGCSSELCVDAAGGDIATQCIYRPEFACLRHTTCGNHGANGACGWDRTTAYEDCLADLACTPLGYERVDVDDLTAESATWDGQAITVCGPIQKGVPYCTKMACSMTNPCCNACSGNLQFNTFVTIAGEGWGCRGNECGTTCTPLDGAELGGYHCVHGTFSASGSGGGTLHVDSFTANCGN